MRLAVPLLLIVGLMGCDSSTDPGSAFRNREFVAFAVNDKPLPSEMVEAPYFIPADDGASLTVQHTVLDGGIRLGDTAAFLTLSFRMRVYRNQGAVPSYEESGRDRIESTFEVNSANEIALPACATHIERSPQDRVVGPCGPARLRGDTLFVTWQIGRRLGSRELVWNIVKFRRATRDDPPFSW